MYNSSITKNHSFTQGMGVETENREFLQSVQSWALQSGGNRARAEEIIQEFLENEEGHSLQLQGLGLTSLPESLGHLGNSLAVLHLAGNALHDEDSVPSSLTYCRGLVEINLSDNSLCTIPSAICVLAEGVAVDLSNNWLQSIDFLEIPNVQFLNMRNNSVESIRGSVGALIKSLDLSGNPIHRIENAGSFVYLEKVIMSLQSFLDLDTAALRQLLLPEDEEEREITLELTDIPGMERSFEVIDCELMERLLDFRETEAEISGDTLQQLSEAWFTEENSRLEVIDGSLKQVVEHFFSSVSKSYDKAVWSLLADQPQAQDLTELLSRLLQTTPMRSESTRNAQYGLVCQTLEVLSSDEDLFQEACAIARDGLETSEDRVALAWSDIQVRSAAFALGKRYLSATELVHFGIGVLHQQTLDRLAQQNSLQDYQRNLSALLVQRRLANEWINPEEQNACQGEEAHVIGKRAEGADCGINQKAPYSTDPLPIIDRVDPILQAPVSAMDVYELILDKDTRKYLLKDNNGKITIPDGLYYIVVEQKMPYTVKCVEHPITGHTSIVEGKPLVFAGEASLDDGVLESWNNSSGHYKPSKKVAEGLATNGNLDALLPQDKFEDYSEYF